MAEWVYYPDEGAGQTNDDRTSTFEFANGVTLYGGFDPQDSVDEFAERDWDVYVTVLSGDIDHETNLDDTDANGVVTDTTNIVGDNVYHVVYSEETAIIDGFTITAGIENGDWPDSYGSGMQTDNCNSTLTNVTFSGNSAVNDGSGIYNLNNTLTLTNTIIWGNASPNGSQIANDGCSVLVSYSDIQGCGGSDAWVTAVAVTAAEISMPTRFLSIR